MVARTHIEQFITDFPALFKRLRKIRVLNRICFADNPMTSLQAEEILGEDAQTLFSLIQSDPKYIAISVQEMMQPEEERN